MARAAMKSVDMNLLKEAVALDEETGALMWRDRPADHFHGHRADRERKRWNGMYAGKRAFAHQSSDGYAVGRFQGVLLKAHRVAWALHHGFWPSGEIDHINGIRTDNRPDNLREVSRIENNRNKAKRKSGLMFQGVCPGKNARKNWVVSIGVNGRTVHVGVFDCLGAAIKARRGAQVAHGFHANHGRAA